MVVVILVLFVHATPFTAECWPPSWPAICGPGPSRRPVGSPRGGQASFPRRLHPPRTERALGGARSVGRHHRPGQGPRAAPHATPAPHPHDLHQQLHRCHAHHPGHTRSPPAAMRHQLHAADQAAASHGPSRPPAQTDEIGGRMNWKRECLRRSAGYPNLTLVCALASARQSCPDPAECRVSTPQRDDGPNIRSAARPARLSSAVAHRESSSWAE